MTSEIHPNLFLSGAPKSGTTSICEWLGQHPDVYLPNEKEPSHFYHPNQKPVDFSTYLNNFVMGSDYRYVLDASIWYLFCEDAIKRINATYPDCKYIICVRNPVDMFFSLHHQKVYSGQELLKDPVDAWNASFQRSEGEYAGVINSAEIDVRHMAYHLSCATGSQILRMLRVVDTNRVFFILFDEIVTNPATMFESVCNWLEIPVIDNVDFTPKNTSKSARSKLLNALMLKASKIKRKVTGSGGSGLLSSIHKLNSYQEKWQAPDPAFKQKLTDFFDDEIKKIEDIFQTSLSHWKQ